MPAPDSKLLDFNVVGVSGLRVSDGRIDDELHARLRGPEALKLYREMSDNDAIIGTILHLSRTWLTQTSWHIAPSDEASEEARAWAEFVDTCRDDMSHTWADFIAELLSFIIYGFSLYEVCYKRREGHSTDPTRRSRYSDGYIGWRKFAVRSQDSIDSWVFDEDQGIRGAMQLHPDTGQRILLPIEKCLLFRTMTGTNSPKGKSFLRNSVRSYLMLKRIQEIRAIGIERDIAGLPVIQAPPELFDVSGTPTQIAANRKVLDGLLDTVTAIRRDEREGLVIPSSIGPDGPTGWKLDLLNSGGTRQFNIDGTIRDLQADIARTFLAEFVLVGDKGGSYAMVDSKTNTFAVSLRSILNAVCEVVNRYAVARLCAINGCPPDLVPALRVGDVAALPLKDVAAFVLQMSQAGMLMYNKETERWVRSQIGMPEPDSDEQFPQSEGVPDLSLPGASPAQDPAPKEISP
jgi:hypothetical protein